MSYSMQEPDWPFYCECIYDEERDETVREDCPLHARLVENSPQLEAALAERKRPRAENSGGNEAAA
jgi:hypothetical protein